MNGRVLITGCSGGGKSTLLAELAARGFTVVEEPGRRIVAEERATGGSALPWIDLAAFARRAMAMAARDHAAASLQPGWIFFDRGLIDAAAALHHATGEPIRTDLLTAMRYHGRVFLAPPWPDIYAADTERQHGFDDAVAEYERLATLLPTLGYETKEIPRMPVGERADFVVEQLSHTPG